ncbi:MAG: chemotaxis response regulator protein-glutamate methylesterase [Rhodospirillales bacterium]|nr:chemotaxis response regulator protein-glutamate methylesterase [Rhodospirillales bacterium]
MVVDDSAVVRGLVSKILAGDPAIEVVAIEANGAAAIARLKRRQDIDVIVLDIDMPVMDGLTALPLLLQARPGVRVIIASSLSQRGAEISVRALEAGAVDCVPKPSGVGAIMTREDFRRDLLGKVRSLAPPTAPPSQAQPPRPALSPAKPCPAVSALTRSPGARPPALRQPHTAAPLSPQPLLSAEPTPAHQPVALRASGRSPVKVIAIGTSTGGPMALLEVFAHLGAARITTPILITQHMPKTFTGILADRIARRSGLACVEATNGQAVESGLVLLAPGDWHMLVEEQVGTRRPVIRLTQDAPENYCRPSVDPMLRSVARVYGAGALAVILTGMGSDGCRGSEAVVAAGGSVIAQDSDTSVVWGMPGAVAAAGLCSAVLPIAEVAPYIVRRLASKPS